MRKIILISIVLFTIVCSCDRFLEEKSDSKLTIPETLEDNQAILDRSSARDAHPTGGEISSDDYYITDSDFDRLQTDADKRLYTWQPDRVAVSGSNDWARIFRNIIIFNTVLDNIAQYKIANSENVRGQALVLRASSYLEAAQLYCLVYDKNTAKSELGLPLRLNSDFNIPSVRTNLQETFDQILNDLHTAVDLLPQKQVHVVRPSKVTALGYLSRTYLYMGDYEKALLYGNKALELYSELMDYNELNSAASYPISYSNKEVLLPTTMSSSIILSKNRLKIHRSFYDSYEENDLRKYILFRPNASNEIAFKGSYTGNSPLGPILAVDELYLIVAESYAQIGDFSTGMNTLNQLLVTRWKTGTFTNFTANTKEEALELIKMERRKELLLRGIRWADLKRYNRDGANIMLTRQVNGKIFTLPANDYRYAIAIPEDIIEMTGMPQNKR